MRGQQSHLNRTLPPEDAATLHAWQRRTTLRAGLARRGRILLLFAEGHTLTAIAGRVGMSRNKLYKWMYRYHALGLDGLQDKAGRGRRKEVA